MTKLEKILSLSLAAVLMLLVVFWNKNNQMARRSNDAIAVIKALRDSTKVRTKEDGSKEFYRQVPVAELKDIVKSIEFDQLQAQQQAFYRELTKIRNLIAASEATIRSKDSTIGSLRAGRVNDSDVCYKLGSLVSIEDSTKALKWKIKLSMNEMLGYNFAYDYSAKVKTNWTRNKDGSIDIAYSLDDPSATVSAIQGFKVPSQMEGKSGFAKWVYKNKKPLILTFGAVAFGSGFYLGMR